MKCHVPYWTTHQICLLSHQLILKSRPAVWMMTDKNITFSNVFILYLDQLIMIILLSLAKKHIFLLYIKIVLNFLDGKIGETFYNINWLAFIMFDMSPPTRSSQSKVIVEIHLAICEEKGGKRSSHLLWTAQSIAIHQH